VVTITPSIVVVSAIIVLALVFFATEPVPVDVTALGVMVTLMLAQPASGWLVSAGLLAEPILLFDPEQYPQQALSGFSSTATLTVLAMFILSDGVQRTGIVQMLGAKISSFTGDSENRQLGATIGVVAPISGFINNTAAVAILLPMVTDLAERGGTSPSKLLLPLSYASMFGGMLTLIGTSTNILASDLAGRLIGRSFTMFEFTELGLVVGVVGTVYLLTVGRWLTPERIKPERDLTEEFEMADYLTEVTVRADSPLVGQQIQRALGETDFDFDLIQLIRDGEVFLEPLGPKEIQAGDVFALRTDRDTTSSNSSSRRGRRSSASRSCRRVSVSGTTRRCSHSDAAGNSSGVGWTTSTSASATPSSCRRRPRASNGSTTTGTSSSPKR
jgi:di/tricarboxylate transporter